MVKIINLDKEKIFEDATDGTISEVIHFLEENQEYGDDWKKHIAVLIEAEDFMFRHYYERVVGT